MSLRQEKITNVLNDFYLSMFYILDAVNELKFKKNKILFEIKVGFDLNFNGMTKRNLSLTLGVLK